jgi:hypothetical protein
MNKHWWQNLESHANKTWSQRGEEGILEHIFFSIGTTNKFLVDIGAGDGYRYSNTRVFIDQGWDSLLIEGNESMSGAGVHVAWVTPDNVNQILADAGVPLEFDLLSIDIDGQDPWVLKELTFLPRVIVAEFNPNFEPGVSRSVERDPDFKHDGSTYFGASFEAMRRIGNGKGYITIGQIGSVNMFMVRREIIPELSELNITYQQYDTHPYYSGDRKWIDV